MVDGIKFFVIRVFFSNFFGIIFFLVGVLLGIEGFIEISGFVYFCNLLVVFFIFSFNMDWMVSVVLLFVCGVFCLVGCFVMVLGTYGFVLSIIRVFSLLNISFFRFFFFSFCRFWIVDIVLMVFVILILILFSFLLLVLVFFCFFLIVDFLDLLFFFFIGVIKLLLRLVWVIDLDCKLWFVFFFLLVIEILGCFLIVFDFLFSLLIIFLFEVLVFWFLLFFFVSDLV